MKTKFYLNHGFRCAQTALKSVLPENQISLEELDKLTGRRAKEITLPIQIAYGLLELGEEFVYPVKSNFLNFSAEDFQRAAILGFGEENVKRTNLDFVYLAREELEKSGNYSIRDRFSIKDLLYYIDKGGAAIALIDYDTFVGREDKKRGHYLVVHSRNGNNFYVMDSGPVGADPNKRVSMKRLEDSLMQTPLDYGIVLV